jgi:uncharacterized membrane protein YcaP (DUF421 family)
MWELTYHWSEIITRAIVIYFALFIIFRTIGKKQLGEMTSMDFILLLIISEAVNGGLVGEEKSLTGALILSVTLIFVNYGMDFLAYKSKKLEKIIDGEAQIIIRQGKICKKVAAKEKITEEEIFQSLRRQNVEKLSDVKFGVLETNGCISIIKN